jgi:predicted nucleic acid-binding protein
VRAAADAGCAKLLSEDLQHQRAFDALVIENPFVS